MSGEPGRPSLSIPAGWPTGADAIALEIVKENAAGEAVARYPGTVVAGGAPAPWIVARAVWTWRPVEQAGLWFQPGDEILEYFSPVDWWNAFAVRAPDGTVRGWYANVTYPTMYDATTDPPRLTWRDLFLDVVLTPGAAPVVLDEDELAEAGLDRADPALHARIVATRDELLRLGATGAFPFELPSPP